MASILDRLPIQHNGPLVTRTRSGAYVDRYGHVWSMVELLSHRYAANALMDRVMRLERKAAAPPVRSGL